MWCCRPENNTSGAPVETSNPIAPPSGALVLADRLEKKLDEYALDGPHERMRLFLTSDPSGGIPIGILNRCIKLTNEPPGGLKANLKRAFCSFNKEYIEELDSKTRSILFGLCHFPAILMERKQYGPLGYNMMYPFSLGDLKEALQKADKDFETGVKELQEKYKGMMESKDAAATSVKEAGLGMLKKVRAHREKEKGGGTEEKKDDL